MFMFLQRTNEKDAVGTKEIYTFVLTASLLPSSRRGLGVTSPSSLLLKATRGTTSSF